MDIIRNKIKPFLDNYLIIFVALFGLLTVLPYISFFKNLQVRYAPGIIYRAVLVSIIGMSFLFVLFVYKTKLPIAVYICTAVYFISQIVTIFISPIIKNVEVPFLTTIMGLGQSVIISLSVLVYLSIKKSTDFNQKTINIVCLSMLSIGVLLCLYTYIFQYKAIYHTFNTEYGWNYDVTSIFVLKTEYGFMLFICSIFSFFYILNNHKYWMYIFPIFFLINMFISRSKTSILCASIILIGLVVIHFIRSWTRYKKTWIISIICVSFAFTSIVILTSLKVGWFERFNYYITQVIFNDAYVVLSDRVRKWGLLINAVNNPFSVVFGYGERITPLVLSDCGCVAIGDNIYLSNYGIGGLIKFIMYLGLAVFIVITTWNTNKNKYKKIIPLIIQLSFLIGGLFEDDSIIGVTMSGLFSSIIFYSCNKMIKVDL